jgi:hypothetical protein
LPFYNWDKDNPNISDSYLFCLEISMTMTLSQLTERHAFLIAQVEASATETTVTIDIPKDALIATNKVSRRNLEQYRGTSPKWRWPAGGIAMIVECLDARMLLTLTRDKAAPSYAGHDTISSGLGGAVRELLYPLETAWREGAEELCIVTPEHVICPIPATDHFGFGLELSEVTRGTANLFPELSQKPIIDTTVQFLALKGERRVVINYLGKTRQTEGLVVFDPGTCGIDIIKATVVPVHCTLSELAVYDGEIGGNSKPLDRQVNAIELDRDFRPTGRCIASWMKGERVSRVDDTANPMSPVLRSVYAALQGR